MTIFLSTNGDLNARKFDVESSLTIGKLMQLAFPNIGKSSDFEEDNEVYIQNQDEDLDKGKTLESYGIKHGDRLFVGKCKRVSVTVSYVGKSFHLETTPALLLRNLKKKVSDHFGMSEEEVSDFQFLLNNEALSDFKIMVGSLVHYSGCSVSLVFAPKKDVNGFSGSEHQIFASDLQSSEYLSGEIDEDWGLEKNNNGSIWPIVIFWIKAKNGEKYHLRFDLTTYNQIAPTAQLWDIITNQPLESNKWPNWSLRCQQVFRAWGKPCLYLPCDRLAFDGHTTWHQEHPNLVWKSGHDSIFKYINEVFQILN